MSYTFPGYKSKIKIMIFNIFYFTFSPQVLFSFLKGLVRDIAHCRVLFRIVLNLLFVSNGSAFNAQFGSQI